MTDATVESSQGLLLRTEFFVLDWTLRFTGPSIVLDGRSYQLRWGEQFFPLERGYHDLQVSYPYLRLSQVGKASAQFDIGPNHLVRATYQAPISVLVAFLPGKLTIEPPTLS
jgi:hypothetical protein